MGKTRIRPHSPSREKTGCKELGGSGDERVCVCVRVRVRVLGTEERKALVFGQ